MLDALLDLFLGVGLAAPAVDLRPARDARPHAMAREIAVHDLVILPIGGLGVDRMRARPDQREISLQHDVEQLRQFIQRRLADEAADASHARIAARHQFGGSRIGLVGVHRAELVDFDQFIVEAVAALAE